MIRTAIRVLWYPVVASLVVVCGPGPAAPAVISSPAQGTAAVTSPTPRVDADVQAAYDRIKDQIPGIPISLIQAAKTEGTVTVYRPTFESEEAVAMAFQKDFPFITVSSQGLSSSPMLQRFMAETTVGKHAVDVVNFTNFYAVDDLIAKGWIARYEVTSDAKYPAYAKRLGLSYPVGAYVVCVAYNPKKVSEADAAALKTWEGVLDPRFSQLKVGINELDEGPGLAKTGFYIVHKAQGRAAWEALKRSNPRVFGNPNALASGEIDMYWPAGCTTVEQIRASGASVRYAYPEPLSIVSYAQVISANAPHPAAARLYQEYALSAKGQAIYSSYGNVTLFPGVKSTSPVANEPWYPKIEGRPVLQLDFAKFAAEWPAIAKEIKATLGVK